MISTKLHGVLDYVVSIVLLALPWLLGVGGNNIETLVPTSLAIATIIYSLCTNYEWGRFKILSMKTHLILDLVNALILASSPWVFDLLNETHLPYLAAGMLELVVIVLSKNRPG